MKVIGITGSKGKTSVSEILYRCLIRLKVRTSLYSSNGFFTNKKTKIKDYFKTNIKKEDLLAHLAIDKQNNIEIAIVEVSAESVLYDMKLEEIEYDLMVITNYIENASTNFPSIQSYDKALFRMIGNQKSVLVNNDAVYKIKSLYEEYKTFGVNCNSDYDVKLLNDSIKGLEFEYNSNIYTSNLITKLNLENLACTIAILEMLNVFNKKKISRIMKKIKIYGRLMALKKNKRWIIVDNGLDNLNCVIEAIINTIQNYNYKIYLSMLPLYYKELINKTDDLIELKKSKWNYLTNEYEEFVEESNQMLKVFLLNKVLNIEYLENPERLLKKATSELEEKELLIILSKHNYRKYIEELRRLKWKN